MPISNSWLNSDLTAILEALSGLELTGTGGSAAYRFAASSQVVVPAGSEIILVPATSEKVQREVSIHMITGDDLRLSWETPPNYELKQLRLTESNNILKDSGAGGLRLSAKATVDTELEIIVRSDSKINYALGGTKPVTIVGVKLLIDTTKDYTTNIQDLDVALQVGYLTGSDDALTGHKLFQITGFSPGEELTFTVDATSAIDYTGSKIDVQWLSNVELVKVLFKTGIHTFLDMTLPDYLSGQGEIGSAFTYAASTESITGGEVKLKPDFGTNVARFVATDATSGVGDTCIITGYTPNDTNPEQGGTFTLGGF